MNKIEFIHKDLTDKKIAEEIEQANEFREKIYAIIDEMEHMGISSKALVPASTADAATPSTSAMTISRLTEPKVRLPKITIQPFDGTPIWDSFNTAIHSNDSLSDRYKFNYLRGLLKGTALEAISGLTLTSSNYKGAVTVLRSV